MFVNVTNTRTRPPGNPVLKLKNSPPPANQKIPVTKNECFRHEIHVNAIILSDYGL